MPNIQQADQCSKWETRTKEIEGKASLCCLLGTKPLQKIYSLNRLLTLLKLDDRADGLAPERQLTQDKSSNVGDQGTSFDNNPPHKLAHARHVRCFFTAAAARVHVWNGSIQADAQDA